MTRPVRSRPRTGVPARLRERPAHVAVALLLAVLALRGWLEWVGPFPGDRWAVHEILHPPQAGPLHDLGDVLSGLARPVVAALMVAAAGWFTARAAGREEALAVVAAAVVAVIVNALLKLLLGPTPLFSASGFRGSNYPSGHTAFATALFGALALAALGRDRRDVAAVFAALVVVMGLTRPFDGSHLVSDVLAGWAVGAVSLLLVQRLRPRA